MKKNLLLGTIIGVVCMFTVVLGVQACMSRETKDQILVDAYVDENYDNGYSAIVIDSEDEGVIKFKVYSDIGKYEETCLYSRDYLRKNL